MIVEKSRTSTRHYQHLKEILGKEYIQSKIESPFDFISLAAKGIDASIILNFRNHFNIPRSFAAELLNVSEPTIYRWVKSKKKLDRNFSRPRNQDWRFNGRAAPGAAGLSEDDQGF
ncbi:MAG: helix-turn-helix domain-containing protein, partial [Fulvivirga sp.]